MEANPKELSDMVAAYSWLGVTLAATAVILLQGYSSAKKLYEKLDRGRQLQVGEPTLQEFITHNAKGMIVQLSTKYTHDSQRENNPLNRYKIAYQEYEESYEESIGRTH